MNEFVLIEFPGKVNDLERALKMLTINLEQDKVELNLHPSETWRPPLIGSIVPFTGLILNLPKVLTRLNSKSNSNAPRTTVNILGKVEKVIRFRKMIDYIVSPGEEPSLMEKNFLDICHQLNLEHIDEFASILQDPEWRAIEERKRGLPTSWVPFKFTSSDFPYLKGIDEGTSGKSTNEPISALSHSSSFGGGSLSTTAKRKGKQASWIKLFAMTEDEMMASPPRELIVKSRRLYGASLNVVHRLFDQRAIWLKSALLQQLPEDIGQTELRTVLPSVAYFFNDGPWRGCWVKYGFDPRRDSSAHIYQVVELRTSRAHSAIAKLPQLLAKRSLTTISKTSQFDGIQLTANLNQLQFCDITYQPIVKVLYNSSNLKDWCDRRHGWYGEGVIGQVRQMIRERWLELLRQADARLYEVACKALPPPDRAEVKRDSTRSQLEEYQVGDQKELGPDPDLGPDPEEPGQEYHHPIDPFAKGEEFNEEGEDEYYEIYE